MTTTIERSVFINASPEVVAAIANDPDRLPEWFAGVTQVESDGKFPEAGGVAEVTYKAAGINFKSKFTSLEFKNAEKYTIQLDGMLTGRNQWVYTPKEKGTTVAFRLEYDMPGGGVGQAVNKLVVERTNEKNVEQSLQNLRKLVEG
jgi:carbon monoxide dehydrogenase subunit G